jgi:hypothetical protein
MAVSPVRGKTVALESSRSDLAGCSTTKVDGLQLLAVRRMRPATRFANLALRFALELAGLAAFGYWGFVVPGDLRLKLLLGLGGPVLAAVLWGLLASPKAAVPLPAGAKLAFELLWFGAAATALAQAGRIWPAVGLATLYVVNRILLAVSGD